MVMFREWLGLHDLDEEQLQDVIAAWRSGALTGDPPSIVELPEQGVEGTQREWTKAECFGALVRPALEEALDLQSEYNMLLKRIEFIDVQPYDVVPPHTVDNGPEAPVLIAMKWQGTPNDMICLAHEVAHALQILLSGHDQMPPVAREVCAFLGEVLVIDHARHAAPDLHAALCDVWRAENDSYFGSDVDGLEAALADPQATYHYRQNYPIARLAAVEMFKRGKGAWLRDLFASGSQGMRHVPVAVMANRAGEIVNYLPPLPEHELERPATDAYRSLGAMALLDIDYWQGEPEKCIEDYYSGLLRHLQDRTAFVALNEQRKPIGYATWCKASQGDSVTLTRQAAPFGDHLTVQRALQRHLGREAGVSARHDRSARQEQLAW